MWELQEVNVVYYELKMLNNKLQQKWDAASQIW